jgi:hypothetical protein
MNSRFGWVTDF